MLLKEWLPQEFFQYKHPEMEKFLNRPILINYNLYNENAWRSWPGKHKYVQNWCIVSYEDNYYAIGFNENPSRGWGFPIKKVYFYRRD